METILVGLGLIFILGIIFWIIDFLFDISSFGLFKLFRWIFKKKD